MSIRNLRYLFKPRSVAVIGASNRGDSVGREVMRNLLRADFHGPIMPVDPNHTSVAGVLGHPDIGSLPDVPDLAVICTPARTTQKASRSFLTTPMWTAYWCCTLPLPWCPATPRRKAWSRWRPGCGTARPCSRAGWGARQGVDEQGDRLLDQPRDALAGGGSARENNRSMLNLARSLRLRSENSSEQGVVHVRLDLQDRRAD